VGSKNSEVLICFITNFVYVKFFVWVRQHSSYRKQWSGK